jgi:hypothetical protein
MFKRVCIWVLLCLILGACRPAPASTPAASIKPAPTQAATPAPALLATVPTPAKAQVDVWADNPNPPMGSMVVVRGYPILPPTGQTLMVLASWSQKGELVTRHEPVVYGCGMFPIEVKDFALGQFVPVTVTFMYSGWQYETHVGFTPR